MTATTVSQFAVELKMPASALLEQLGKAGGIPAVLWRARGEETDIFLCTEANQRLPEGIPAAQ